MRRDRRICCEGCMHPSLLLFYIIISNPGIVCTEVAPLSRRPLVSLLCIEEEIPMNPSATWRTIRRCKQPYLTVVHKLTILSRIRLQLALSLFFLLFFTLLSTAFKTQASSCVCPSLAPSQSSLLFFSFHGIR